MEIIVRTIESNLHSVMHRRGFVFAEKKTDEQYFEIKYQSTTLRIRLENYRRELYLYLAPAFDVENEVNIFMLTEYFEQDKALTSRYYHEVDDAVKAYELQAIWLAKVLEAYFPKIEIFFSEDNYPKEKMLLSKYIFQKYPQFFGRP